MVEDCKEYQDGKEICQQLKEKIEKGDITIDLLKVLDNERKKVSMLCASVVAEQASVQTFEDKITELMGVVKDCSKKTNLPERTINHGKKLWKEIYHYPISEIHTVIEIFDKPNKNRGSRKAYELQALLPFVNQGEALHPWLDSISFRAVAKRGLQESRKSSNEDEN